MQLAGIDKVKIDSKDPHACIEIKKSQESENVCLIENWQKSWCSQKGIIVETDRQKYHSEKSSNPEEHEKVNCETHLKCKCFRSKQKRQRLAATSKINFKEADSSCKIG